MRSCTHDAYAMIWKYQNRLKRLEFGYLYEWKQRPWRQCDKRVFFFFFWK